MNQANFKRSRFWFAALFVLCVLLVILLVLTAFDKAPQRKEKEPVQTEQTEAPEAGLKMNAYPKVNVLIEKFYTAQTHGNTEILKEIVKPFGESDETVAARKSEFIEGYENVNCYTEDGVDKGTYIVFASYDLKFPNVDTTVPGLETMIVCTDEEGAYYINNDQSTLSEAMQVQLNEVFAREDVKTLFSEVENHFNTVVQSDENIKSLCEQMGMDVTSLAAAETETPASAAPAATAAPIGKVEKEMMAVADLEVYSSPQEGDVVGNAPVGGLIWVAENVEGGFSSVEVEASGVTGYVRTTGLASFAQVDEEISATVNYYGSCSDSAAVLGTITSDQLYYCTLQFDNGWCQLIVNGSKVYVKSAEIGR